jgi:CubicO group peptidase (beta-lactamase class C family)
MTAAQPLPELNKWIPDREIQAGECVEQFMERQQTTAFIVLRNDSLLYERYFNAGTPEQARIVFSVTKAITATLTAIAIEEGRLRLEQPVADFLPAFAKNGREKLQIQHLMNMLAGLKWNDYKSLWLLGNLYYTGNQERFVCANAHQQHQVGTHFSYQSIATQILGVCLEKAVEQPLARYLSKKLWQPVGMKYNAYWTLDNKKNRQARTFGGLALTAPDMARFGQLMAQRGKWNGQQVVPLWFVEDLETRSSTQWFGYQYSYWRNGYEEADFVKKKHYWAAGYKGQYIYIAPEENIVVVRIGKSDDSHWAHNIGRLVHLLDRGKNDLTHPELDYSAQFAGVYCNEKGDSVYIKALPDLPQQPKRWRWRHNLRAFEGRKPLEILAQFDGISIGFKRRHQQTRLYYDLKDKQVVGFYHNSWPTTNLHYYKKIR